MESMEVRHKSPATRQLIITIQRVAAFASRHWLAFFNGFWGALVIGAFLPPLFMAMGWEGAAKASYTAYSFTCHQLPERSFFLFGEQDPFAMYDKDVIVAAGANPASQLTMRQFVGDEQLGYKLGFSDRMVSMYGGAFIGGLIYALLARRGRVKPIPLWLLFLLVLPMALDGTTHFLSDIVVTGDPTALGFRDTNLWARPFFPGRPDPFFTTNHFGSLNSDLRLWTGLLFGVGMMLYAYPLIGESFDELSDDAEAAVARNQARHAAAS